MPDTSRVTQEYDSHQHILISRITGLIGLHDMIEIIASGAQLCTEHGAKGYILDFTGACTCLERSDIPIFVSKATSLLGKLPVAGVDPHNHERSMQAAAMAVCHGSLTMACLTLTEARLFIDYATGRHTRRAMRLNHLIHVASSLPEEYLAGLISALESFSKRP